MKKFSVKNSTQKNETLVEIFIENKIEDINHTKKAAVFNNEILNQSFIDTDGTLIDRQHIISIQEVSTGFEDNIIYKKFNLPLTKLESSFKQTRTLSKGSLLDLTTFLTTSCYKIKTDLEPGIYKTTFVYHASYEEKDAIILIDKTKSLLLIGKSKNFISVDKETNPEYLEAKYASQQDENELDL